MSDRAPVDGYLALSVLPDHRRARLAVTIGELRFALTMDRASATRFSEAFEFISFSNFSLPLAEDGSIRWRVDGSVQVLGAILHERHELGDERWIELEITGVGGSDQLHRRLYAAFETFADLHPRVGDAPELYGLARSQAVGSGAEFGFGPKVSDPDHIRRALGDTDHSLRAFAAGDEGVLEAAAVERGDEDGPRTIGARPETPWPEDLEGRGEDARSGRGADVGGVGGVSADRDGRAGSQHELQVGHDLTGVGVATATVGRPADGCKAAAGGDAPCTGEVKAEELRPDLADQISAWRATAAPPPEGVAA